MFINGACYIRVSTEDQTEFSPDAQLRALRDYANKNAIHLSDEHIYIDAGISGRQADKRPAFMKMIATAKATPKSFDVILVHKFDRFARSREDSVVYKSLLKKEAGIKVISITESIEDDKFSVILEAMLEAMAEYYSLNLADEVKKGLFEKARRGENIGKAPYGYRLENSKLVPVEAEAEIVKMIFNMYKTQSVSKITRYLNSNRIPTKTNGRWTQTTLIYILQNPVYYGTLRYNYRKRGWRKLQNSPSEWILSASKHQSLISEECFAETQKKLSETANVFGRNFDEKSIKSWLQHISRCSHCGSILTVSSCNDGKYKMFRCSRTSLGTCKTTNTYSSRKFENQALAQITRDMGNFSSITLEKIKDSTLKNDYESLNKQLIRVREKYKLARQAYLAQVDTLDEYKANKNTILQEEKHILFELEKDKKKNEENPRTDIQVNSFLELLSSENLTQEEKNSMVKQFIKEVRLNLESKEIRIIYYV